MRDPKSQSPRTVNSMDIQAVRALLKEDMQAVNQLIHQQLRSEVALINQISAYIVNSGGKRLRPVLVLLAARACNYAGDRHVDAAAIIEFIHTATLLHDDVVDASDLRRGRDTANAVWGNEASVLVGDFLYSRSFQMMVDIGSLRVMDILANTTNTIAEGEVMQLLNCNDPDTSEERYMQVIYCKTAKLFEAATQLGAVLAERPNSEEQALANYGVHLGTAFQLVDDLLDYSKSSAEIGKNVGDDLAEGKPTLPLIYAMRNGSSAQTQLIRQAIEQGARENIDSVIEAIETTGAIAYTAQLAQQEADRAISALQSLPDSSYKQALIGIAEFSVNRTH
jgi:octaprenyl-diphosphate synthase